MTLTKAEIILNFTRNHDITRNSSQCYF